MSDEPTRLPESELVRLVKEHRNILKKDPSNLVAKRRLADALRDLGRVSEAADHYRELARAYRRTGKTVQALTICKVILELRKTDPEIDNLLDELTAARKMEGVPSDLKLKKVDGLWIVGSTKQEEGSSSDDDSVEIAIEAELPPQEPEAIWPADQLARAFGSGALKEKHTEDTTSDRAGWVPVDDRPGESVRQKAEDDAAGPYTRTSSRPILKEIMQYGGFEDEEPTNPGASDYEENARLKSMGFDPDDSASRKRRTLVGLARQSGTIEELDGEKAFWPDEQGMARPTSQSLNDLKAIMPGEGSGELRLDSDEEEIFAEMSRGGHKGGLASAVRGQVAKAVSLSEIPIFKDLPPEAFEMLTSRMIRRKEEAGKVVIREGDPGNAFFVLISGRVQVEKNLSSGQKIQLAELPPGSFFGEFALLSDRKRHATVVTLEPSEILEISRKIMGELIKRYHDVARILRRFYRKRLLATLLASAPFFEPLTAEEKKKLTGKLRFRRFTSGQLVLQEGSEGGGFFLILIGEVKVTVQINEEEKELARLGDGMYFGEMSLLRGQPAMATVTAIKPTEVVQLETSDFYRILSNYPQIWEEVNREARRRELANHAILAGQGTNTPTFDGGVVM